jgi:hypothetical protein
MADTTRFHIDNNGAKLIGFEMLAQYYSAVLKVLERQTFNNLTKE